MNEFTLEDFLLEDSDPHISSFACDLEDEPPSKKSKKSCKWVELHKQMYKDKQVGLGLMFRDPKYENNVFYNSLSERCRSIVTCVDAVYPLQGDTSIEETIDLLNP